MWQCFGAAIALPLYFRQHLAWTQSTLSHAAPARPAAVKALLFSFPLGAVLPAVVGLLPIFYPRTSSLHQTILAAWQIDPVYVSAIQALVTYALTQRTRSTAVTDGIWWSQLVYLIAAVISAMGHIGAMAWFVSSNDPLATLTNAYLPFPLAGPLGASPRLASGPWLFLQFDLIIITLSCISWAYLLTVSLLTESDRRRTTLPWIFAGGVVLLGTGATVSLALLWREHHLQAKRDGEKPKSER